MYNIILSTLLILGISSNCPDTRDSDVCGGGDPGALQFDCCTIMDGGCSPASGADCIIDTEPPATTDSNDDNTDTTEADCDNSDLNEWRVDYIGKSTQFRIYDPCDNKFIKFKMEDLTEYDDDKKTTNKETSFASAKDWEWGQDSGTVVNYQGNDAIYNAFVADELTKVEASLTLETRVFMDQVNITDPDDANNTITLRQNSLKFNVDINDWPYLEDDNYLILCIGIMTNKAGDIDDDPDTKTFYLDGFEIDNAETALCRDSQGNYTNINVTIDRDGNGNNHLDLCYTFDHCNGNIHYDPTVQIVDGDNDNSGTTITGDNGSGFAILRMIFCMVISIFAVLIV